MLAVGVASSLLVFWAGEWPRWSGGVDVKLCIYNAETRAQAKYTSKDVCLEPPKVDCFVGLNEKNIDRKKKSEA